MESRGHSHTDWITESRELMTDMLKGVAEPAAVDDKTTGDSGARRGVAD